MKSSARTFTSREALFEGVLSPTRRTPMKMSDATYQKLKTDLFAVIEADDSATDWQNVTMGYMWDAFNQAHIERYYESHHLIARNGPRTLPYTGEHLYDLIYKAEDLDDANVETAFRRMIREWSQPLSRPAKGNPALSKEAKGGRS